jgi:hypothetical protein
MSLSNILFNDTKASFKEINANEVNADNMSCASAPVSSTDVANKSYVDGSVGGGGSVDWVSTVGSQVNLTGAPDVVFARYLQVGKLVLANIEVDDLLINAANTNSSFIFTLPVNAFAVGAQIKCIGQGRIFERPITNLTCVNSGLTPGNCTVNFTSGAADAGQPCSFMIQVIYESV